MRQLYTLSSKWREKHNHIFHVYQNAEWSGPVCSEGDIGPWHQVDRSLQKKLLLWWWAPSQSAAQRLSEVFPGQMINYALQKRNFYCQSSYKQVSCILECHIEKAISEMEEADKCIPWYFPPLGTDVRMCTPYESRNFNRELNMLSDDECPVWMRYHCFYRTLWKVKNSYICVKYSNYCK